MLDDEVLDIADIIEDEWDLNLSKKDLEMLAKEISCDKYRKEDCNGCPNYDPEDQVCRFDK